MDEKVSTTYTSINQQGTGASWHFIGNYEFDSGGDGYITITDIGASGGNVIMADGLRLIRTSTLDNIENQPEYAEFVFNISPNPFNNSCLFKFSKESYNTLHILDINSNIIYSNNNIASEIRWQPENLPSGIYFAVIQSNDRIYHKKVVFIR